MDAPAVEEILINSTWSRPPKDNEPIIMNVGSDFCHRDGQDCLFSALEQQNNHCKKSFERPTRGSRGALVNTLRTECAVSTHSRTTYEVLVT